MTDLPSPRPRARWKRRAVVVAAALVTVLMLIGALANSGDDAGQGAGEDTTATSSTATSRRAVDVAVGPRDLAFLSRKQLVGMVEDGCMALVSDASTPEIAERVVRSLDREVKELTSAQVVAFTEVLADVAPEACPDGVVRHPDLLNRVLALAPTTTTALSAAPSGGGPYANCTEARAAGAAPLHRDDPGYAPKLDRDGNGIACE